MSKLTLFAGEKINDKKVENIVGAKKREGREGVDGKILLISIYHLPTMFFLRGVVST